MCLQINGTKRNIKNNNRDQRDAAETREWRRNCREDNEPKRSAKSPKITKSDIASMISTYDSSDSNEQKRKKVEIGNNNNNNNSDNYPKVTAEKCSKMARLKVDCSMSMRSMWKFEDLQFMNEVNSAENCANNSEEDSKLRLNGDSKDHFVSLSDSSLSARRNLLSSKHSTEVNNLESTTKQSSLIMGKIEMSTEMRAPRPRPRPTARQQQAPLTTIIEKCKRRKRKRKRNLSSELEELNHEEKIMMKKKKMVMMIKQFNSLKESSLIPIVVVLSMFIVFTFTATATTTTLTSYSAKSEALVASTARTAHKTGKFTLSKARFVLLPCKFNVN